jgi:Tfp pilus assembly protein PilO
MNALTQTPAPPAPPEIPVIVGGPDPNFLIPQIIETILIGVVMIGLTYAAVKIFGPLIAAWARRIEGRGGDSALRGELEQVRQELAEVDGLRARVGELEERVDFTERLLANQRSESQLPRGGPA